MKFNFEWNNYFASERSEQYIKYRRKAEDQLSLLLSLTPVGHLQATEDRLPV